LGDQEFCGSSVASGCRSLCKHHNPVRAERQGHLIIDTAWRHFSTIDKFLLDQGDEAHL
jgi:hypothetical protein